MALWRRNTKCSVRSFGCCSPTTSSNVRASPAKIEQCWSGGMFRFDVVRGVRRLSRETAPRGWKVRNHSTLPQHQVQRALLLFVVARQQSLLVWRNASLILHLNFVPKLRMCKTGSRSQYKSTNNVWDTFGQLHRLAQKRPTKTSMMDDTVAIVFIWARSQVAERTHKGARNQEGLGCVGNVRHCDVC